MTRADDLSLASASPAADQRHAGMEYPSWVPRLTLGIVAFLAILGSLPHDGVAPHPAAVALVWLSAVPWMLDVVGAPLHRFVFGLAVMVPQALLHVGGEALGIADLTHEGPTHLAVMIVVFAVGEVAATSRWRDTLLVTAMGAGILVGRTLVEPEFSAGVFWAGGAVMAMGIGYMMRRQAETTFQLRSAQDALAREAVAQERHRIAREVHDAIAHTLTVTMMHLTAARMAVRRDPDEAESTLAEAERLGRQSLADIRRTVSLLREEAPTSVESPQPHVEDLERLVDDYRAAGMDVDLDVDGEAARLTASAGLTVYRIVQESLTNVGKHAPGSGASVRLRVDDDAVDLTVRNELPAGARPGREPAGGMGIVGMRERAALLDGTLQAGPDGDGWLVRCHIPLTETDRRRTAASSCRPGSAAEVDVSRSEGSRA